MTEADLPRAAALSAAAGWNQVAADWSLFLHGGEVRVLDDGDPACLAASAAVLPYGADLAWISMVLVRPDRRRAGLATALMRWAVGRLAGMRHVALDATPAGREVYARLGFRDLLGFARWSVPRDLPAPARAVRPLRPEDWPALLALDAAAFGAPRAAPLRNFARRRPDAAFVTPDLRGFVLARDGLRAPQIGPVVAPDEPTAIALVAAARAALGVPAVLDLADSAGGVAAALAAQGGERLRPFTRMVLGDAGFGKAERNFAFAGPEFG
ncbi:GNAT family N-acetyltransferase [Falsiroseomonas sp. CW058]|uniref:GNAT family N-acetyltransferase n=1 Tax=Falsiroseomonas sp. CW058 TaxID=3388664 RepID=UPI003D322CAB